MDIDIEKLEKTVLGYLPNRCGRQFAERIRSGEFNARTIQNPYHTQALGSTKDGGKTKFRRIRAERWSE